IDQLYVRYLFGYQEEMTFQKEGEDFTGMIVGVDERGRLAIAEGQKLNYYDFKDISFLYN
ncbi:MAG: biotin--[acetyl-CoA-carboxylase] ligase, partial [Bacteroidota bacterium]